MALAHDLPPAAFTTETRWSVADDLPDLTDRRRILLGFLLAVRVSPDDADAVFAVAPGAQRPSSSAARSPGPSPDTRVRASDALDR